MPFVGTNGIRMHYEEQGEGEPLVLLMGLGAPLDRWELHAAAYARRFRCILVDNRGAGESDRPRGPYTTAMMAADTAGLMDALGIEQARVAGISMGSGIAQELALGHPEKVRSLVLVASWSRCDAYTRGVFEHFKAMRAVASPADFMQLLQLWIFTAAHYETHLDEMLAGQRSAAEGTMPLEAFVAQCDACITHNTYDRLGRIQAPALLTSGDTDIFTPVRLSEEMNERMPDAELLVLHGRGHAHHWEDLETFNARALEFLLSH